MGDLIRRKTLLKRNDLSVGRGAWNVRMCT